MQRFSKILVPVDFSADSAEATRVAADLARRFHADLTLIYVYDALVYSLPDGFVAEPPLQVKALVEAFTEQLADGKRQALAAGAPRVEAKLLEGSVATEIVEYARAGELDLVVMGTRGRTGMSHLLMGSIAERVVRLSPCPVLTVKKATTAPAGA